MFLKKIITNKVVFYLITRYFVYFISFLTSLLVANKLGPYYLGIWGFILLIIGYFHIIDFGIGNAMTVFLVKNKTDKREQAEYEVSAMLILAAISLLVICLALIYKFHGLEFLEKYQLENLLYAIVAIAIMQYFNDYFCKVYRVKGKIFQLTFYQSFIQLLLFLSVFLANGKQLIILLTISYCVGHLVSLFLFLLGRGINLKGKPSLVKVKSIISNGVFLFVYNFAFYMIMLSTKTMIGANYSVEEFGFFTFSYTLANAALLLFTAFASLVTPKLIDKFNTTDINRIRNTVKLLRVNYVYLSHGLLYAAVMLFPVLLLFMPQYSETTLVINLMVLATLLYTNSYGYVSLLMTKRKERLLARNSLISLLVNITFGIVLIKLIHVPYEYVVLGVLVAYFVFSYLTVFSGKKAMKVNAGFKSVMKECFPIGILIPFLSAVVITLVNAKYLMFIPFATFACMNVAEIKEIATSFKRIIIKPDIVDVSQ